MPRVRMGLRKVSCQGPPQAYSEVLTGLCSSLELDTSSLVEFESDLVATQAVTEWGVVEVVERMRSDTVLLYERLDRLGEVVSMAGKGEM